MLKLKSLRKLMPLVKPLLLVVSLVAVFALIVEIPNLRREWMRQKVADRVFEIKGIKDGGGGTGFQVEAPSGQAFIVTNSHVCEIAQKDGEDKNFLLVKKTDHWMKRRILEVDEQSDLCLVEAWPHLSGLSLGEMLEVGDEVTAIGHPHLGPITMMSGEVTAFTNIQMMHHLMISNEARKDKFFGATSQACNLPKNEIKKQEFFFFGLSLGEMTACMVNEKEAIQTNVTIFPGNSGSPLVDASGKVVGVIFASNTRSNWGYAVNLNHLKLLLQDF